MPRVGGRRCVVRICCLLGSPFVSPLGLLHGRRVEELAFAEGRGPDPRTKDSVGGVQSVRDDPLQ